MIETIKTDKDRVVSFTTDEKLYAKLKKISTDSGDSLSKTVRNIVLHSTDSYEVSEQVKICTREYLEKMFKPAII